MSILRHLLSPTEKSENLKLGSSDLDPVEFVAAVRVAIPFSTVPTLDRHKFKFSI
ncbi:MAG: hypothetical protein AB7O96_04405 [Pseudobdellovibrionaceae bacterium]